MRTFNVENYVSVYIMYPTYELWLYIYTYHICQDDVPSNTTITRIFSTPLLFWEEEDDPSYHRMRQKKIFVRAVACHNNEEENCPTKPLRHVMSAKFFPHFAAPTPYTYTSWLL